MAADTEKTVEQRVVAFAEQLGRLVGTVESKAEGWMDQKALNNQLTQIRDGATELLNQLGGALAAGRAATNPKKKQETARTSASAGRSGGKVDAPGKTHRKRGESTRGAKHSNQMIPKSAVGKMMRRPQRRGPG
jgi:hypothetical protein